MALTRAQAIYTWWQATGGLWPTSPEGLAGAMASPDVAGLAHHLRTFPGGIQSAAPPEWLVRDLAPEIGTEQAGLLLVPGFAPIILEGLAAGWTPQRVLTALQATDTYKAMNARQIAWAQGNPADQERQVSDAAASVWNHLRHTYGIDQVNARGWTIDSPYVRERAQRIASGATPEDVVLFQLTTEAESVQGTPAMAALINQRTSAGQWSADIENTQAKMAAAWREWMGETTPISTDLAVWAADVTQNRRTMADFETFLRDTARSLYPTKPEYISFRQWVEMPKSMIQSTLELPNVADNDLYVQSFIRGEIPSLADLNQRLRRDPRYDRTTTAIRESRQLGAGILERWGFI